MGRSLQSLCKRITSVCFLVSKRTKNKLPFTLWANGKQIKENHLDFYFLFEVWNRQQIYIGIYIHCSDIYMESGTNRNGNFCLFAANGKWKWQTSVCLQHTEMKNGSLFSFGRQMINGNQQMLFQQTCTSMIYTLCPWYSVSMVLCILVFCISDTL